MFKDEYLLDFMNTEELTARFGDVNERVVENEIVANIRKFILTFGKDFSFILIPNPCGNILGKQG